MTIRNSGQLALYQDAGQQKLEAWSEFAKAFLQTQRRIILLVAQHDLTLPQFDILATLLYSEGVSQQELARRLLVSKGNVCGVLDRLEAWSLVQRKSDSEDSRANKLYLTTAGKRRLGQILPEHDQLLLQIMGNFSGPEMKIFRTMLRKFDLE